MNEGWKCPVCGRGVAPSEKHCDHGGGIAAIPLPTPWGNYPDPYMPVCGCKIGTMCLNVACPHRTIATFTGTDNVNVRAN